MLGLGVYESSSEDEAKTSRSIPSKLAVARSPRKDTQSDDSNRDIGPQSLEKVPEKGALPNEASQSPGEFRNFALQFSLNVD